MFWTQVWKARENSVFYIPQDATTLWSRSTVNVCKKRFQLSACANIASVVLLSLRWAKSFVLTPSTFFSALLPF